MSCAVQSAPSRLLCWGNADWVFFLVGALRGRTTKIEDVKEELCQEKLCQEKTILGLVTV